MENQMLDGTIRDFEQVVYTKEEVIEQIKEYDRLGYKVYIGTDSQIFRKKISIATCICFHSDDLGCAKIFYVKERIKKRDYPSLRSRMWLEAYRSVELAFEIQEMLSSPITIHIDVGDTYRSKTALYEQELQALVSGQGFGCAIKPDSWAASAVADRVAKS
jgi:predicted RNase H-related nuclease YkuK (DUF458 family)